MAPDIRFPHLGIDLERVNRVAMTIFKFGTFEGLEIYFYSLCIFTGVMLAYLLAVHYGKQDKMETDDYFDYAFILLISGILGARLYFVVFSWDNYKDNLLKIFNFRSGGLAIYGGIIAAAIMSIFYCNYKKWDFFRFADTVVPGVLVGQIFGRWGNFFNREAFGDFSNNLLAMQLKVSDVHQTSITETLQNNIVRYMNVDYIQVHPTFLYESLWNVGILIMLHLYRKHKKFDGEIFCLYFVGYGIGRFWIEGLRTDQLLLFGTGFAASQLLSILLVIFFLGGTIYGRYKQKNEIAL